jgi:hypothetical protein
MRNESGRKGTALVTNRRRIRIRFDYPLCKPVTFTYKSKHGFTLREFLARVNRGYRRIYRTMPSNTWGHVFEDLGFEGYRHVRKGLYSLQIGS